MPLVNLNLPIEPTPLPGDVSAFLREADRRIERFCQQAHIPGFVPSDYTTAYAALRAVAADGVAPGNLLCEWGSGFGVVACLAAMLGFDACGIEIEGELVDAARQLAEDFDVPVEFVRGTFIPEGSEVCIDAHDGFAWLTTDVGGSTEELGLGPADFDVVFAYPWPDEECVVSSLFERHAVAGAVLLTYHGGEAFRARRKLKHNGRSRGRSRR